ncbi:hypothetical protein PS2_010204 [Malus domestica]
MSLPPPPTPPCPLFLGSKPSTVKPQFFKLVGAMKKESKAAVKKELKSAICWLLFVGHVWKRNSTQNGGGLEETAVVIAGGFGGSAGELDQG